MNQGQYHSVTQWQKETFPKSTAQSKLYHLAGDEPGGEVAELIEDLKMHATDRRLEFADCFILLMGAAAADGMTYDQVVDAINEKMNINKSRKWGEPDKNGVVNHVKKEYQFKFREGSRELIIAHRYFGGHAWIDGMVEMTYYDNGRPVNGPVVLGSLGPKVVNPGDWIVSFNNGDKGVFNHAEFTKFFVPA